MPEPINGKEILDLEEENTKLDFQGQWILANNLRAEVKGQFLNYWFGFIYIGTLEVPSMWDSKGNSTSSYLNLVRKRRGQELWGEVRDDKNVKSPSK